MLRQVIMTKRYILLSFFLMLALLLPIIVCFSPHILAESSTKASAPAQKSSSSAQKTPAAAQKSSGSAQKTPATPAAVTYVPNPHCDVELQITNSAGIAFDADPTGLIAGKVNKISGDIFKLTIKFDRLMDASSLRAITLVGYPNLKLNIDNSYNEGKATCVTAELPELVLENKYTLKIPKTVKDRKGNSLKEELKSDVIFYPATKAEFTLVGKDGKTKIESLRGYDQIEITNTPKTFLVDFSADVNVKSVTDNLKQNLPSSTKLIWNNSKQLVIDISHFQEFNSSSISFQGAQDAKGNKIFGHIGYTIGTPNILCYIDLQTWKLETVCGFRDFCYMIPDKEQKIGNYLYLENSNLRQVFNVKTRTMFRTLPTEWHYLDYLNQETLLFSNSTNSRFFQYSMRDDSFIQLFTMLDEPTVTSYCLSPDRQSIAFFTTNRDVYGAMENKLDLRVYSTTTGKLLYNYLDIITMYIPEGSLIGTDSHWTEKAYIISSDYIAGKQSTVKIELATGKKQILKDVQDSKNTQSRKDSQSTKNGQVVKDTTLPLINRIETGEYGVSTIPGYENLYVGKYYQIGADKLVYNLSNGDCEYEILLFDAKKGASKKLASGCIIGISTDGTKLYYLKNYVNWIEYQ